MEPATMSDVKELMKDLLKECRESIKEAVAEAFGNSKPALEHATTSNASQLLTMDASDAKVPEPACSSPDQGTSALDLAPTAIINIIPELAASVRHLNVDDTGVAAPPTICSTDGHGHDTDEYGSVAVSLIPWSTIHAFTASRDASMTQPCRLFVALELDTMAPTRCSTMCFVDGTNVFTYMFVEDVTQSIMRQGQVLRPRPWPSFECYQEDVQPMLYRLPLRRLYVELALVIWAKMNCSLDVCTHSWELNSLDCGGSTLHATSRLVLNVLVHWLIGLACRKAGSRHPVAAPVRVASSPPTLADQRITSKVSVLRPIPWSSFMDVLADGDGTHPLPWLLSREVNSLALDDYGGERGASVDSNLVNAISFSVMPVLSITAEASIILHGTFMVSLSSPVGLVYCPESRLCQFMQYLVQQLVGVDFFGQENSIIIVRGNTCQHDAYLLSNFEQQRGDDSEWLWYLIMPLKIIWSPHGYLSESRNQMNIMFPTTSTCSHWLVVCVCDGPTVSSLFSVIWDEWVLQPWNFGQQADVSYDQFTCANSASVAMRSFNGAPSMIILFADWYLHNLSIANGAEMVCSQEILECKWEAQGHLFTTSFKVLPLGCFDIILGMDWVETHNPDVDWVQKTVKIQLAGQAVELQGQNMGAEACATISFEQLSLLCEKREIDQLILLSAVQTGNEQAAVSVNSDAPDEVQKLLQQYSDVFADPSALPPRRACDHFIPSSPAPELNTWLQEQADVSALIKQHLLRAQTRLKTQADKNRTERSFDIGDEVFVKLQPYVQSSVAKRACHKLSFRYFGPFPIKERIGQVAYRIGLPKTSLIHPVFHVSQLRKALKSGVYASPTLPHDANQFAIPVRVLDARQKNKANRLVDQVLIRWSREHREELHS